MGRVVLWNGERVFKTREDAKRELMLTRKEFMEALATGKARMVYPVYRIRMRDGSVVLGRESKGCYYDMSWGNRKRSKDIVKVEDITARYLRGGEA